MRLIRQIFLAFLAICLFILAIANRQIVTLKLIPDEIHSLFPSIPSESGIDMPLFVVVLLAVLIGIIIGFLWEYLLEGKGRTKISKSKREISTLEKENARLRKKAGEGKDEILSLVE